MRESQGVSPFVQAISAFTMPESLTSSLGELRRAGLEAFLGGGLPTTREEAWRFTPLTGLADQTPQLAGRVSEAEAERVLRDAGLLELLPRRLVVANGQYLPGLSAPGSLPKGVVAGSLAAGLETAGAELVAALGACAPAAEDRLAGLNTAFFTDGVLLAVPRGVVLEEPIHLIFLTIGEEGPRLSLPRGFLRLGRESGATLVESHVSVGAGSLSVPVMAVSLAEGASLTQVRLGLEGDGAYHLGSQCIRQERDSQFKSQVVTLGGSVARADLSTRLNGEGARCELLGLYLAKGSQLLDHHTSIDHVAPHCESQEIYRGILDDKSRGVFNGLVVVRPGAQKTNAQQENRNLVLSSDALVNTQPQLEIYADDVKCAHGATIGRLSEEALFYLRARGIGADEARGLLTLAFAQDIVDRIKLPAVSALLETRLQAWFGRPLA